MYYNEFYSRLPLNPNHLFYRKGASTTPLVSIAITKLVNVLLSLNLTYVYACVCVLCCMCVLCVNFGVPFFKKMFKFYAYVQAQKFPFLLCMTLP